MMGIALPLQKENNEYHPVSRAPYLKSTWGSLDDIQMLCSMITYVFALTLRRGQK
jgi:hypothetical protein